ICGQPIERWHQSFHGKGTWTTTVLQHYAGKLQAFEGKTARQAGDRNHLRLRPWRAYNIGEAKAGDVLGCSAGRHIEVPVSRIHAAHREAPIEHGGEDVHCERRLKTAHRGAQEVSALWVG